ncbi:MAG: hypothetical protein RL376_945 [Verrucomicrobiota bacterium]|jgi:integrase
MSLIVRGPWFWGEFVVKNERKRLNLGVRVEGTVPKPLNSPGDAVFERSRGKALAAYEEFKADMTDPTRAAQRLEKIHHLSTGNKIRATPMNELYAVWEKAPRKKDVMSCQHKEEVKKLIDELIAFAKGRNSQVDEARKVTFEIAADFMRIRAQGVAPKTHDNLLLTLRAVFTAAANIDGVTGNPFKKIPLKKGASISRIPFSEHELKSILSAAESDDEIGGVVVAAACSGMRRADCATLHWSKVDLSAGYVVALCSKNKKEITLPILAPLRKVLEKLKNTGGFCFPKSAEMMEKNPDGLNWRLAKLAQKAGVKLTAVPLGKDQPRKRAPSEIGFHRFKATFVTLALDAGIPIPVIQKIVGNSDVRVLLKHYHRPDKKTLTDQMDSKLPTFLTGNKTEPSATAKARLMIEGMNAENWQMVRVEVLKLLTPVTPPSESFGGTFGGTPA